MRNIFCSYLRFDLCVFCMTIEICGYSQLDLCVLFYSYFYGHEVLLRKLQFMRLFSVRFMRWAWKFHPFQFKCVCSFYILFVYRIVLFYLQYLPQMNFSFENVLQVHKQRSSRCSHWSRICFASSWDLSCQEFELFVIAVISGYLRLRMRWV